MTATATDEPLIALYNQWQEAHGEYTALLAVHVVATEARHADPAQAERIAAAQHAAEPAQEAALDREDGIAWQIARTPPRTIAGVMVKVQMAEMLMREGTIGHAPADLPGVMALNTMRDARRFLARADADALQIVPEMPSNSLAAAEAEVARLYALWDELDDGTDACGSNEAGDKAVELDHFIAETPPASMADVAVKLRRLLDASVGLPSGSSPRDVVSLAQILAYVETITGKPTHSTRPTSTGLEDEDGEGAESDEIKLANCQVDSFTTDIAASRREPSPELAALVAEMTAEVGKYNESDDGEVNYRRSSELFRKIKNYTPRSLADVLLKSRAAETYGGEPCGENAEWNMASDNVLALIRKDVAALAAIEPETDPLIALCAEWHQLTDEEIEAYNRVPDGPENEAAQAEAEAAQERANAVYDQIKVTVPATLAGYLAQLQVVRRLWLNLYGGPYEDPESVEFSEPLQQDTYCVLGHAARFGSRA